MTDESTETKPVFGNLTPAEAGRRSVEARRQKRDGAKAVESGVISPDSNGRIESALRAKAEKGDVAASRVLADLGTLTADSARRSSDMALLALLTPAQRACIEAHLRDEHITEEQAYEAWVRDDE